MIDLSKRSTQRELMDDFHGNPKALEDVLNDITRVNTLLGGSKITENAVFKLIREDGNKSYTILDVGCADGHMLRALAKRARKVHTDISFIGVDLNEEALRIAKQKSKDFPEISYRNQDVFTMEGMDLDLIITTLTLHHFGNGQIPELLARLAHMARLGVVINDLQRSCVAYYLFRVFSAIFIKTSTAKIDGLISIARGFRRMELRAFAQDLPGFDHLIAWKWAFRYLWVIKRKVNIHE